MSKSNGLEHQFNILVGTGFMIGVMVTLFGAAIAVESVQKSERNVGRCEAGCKTRGYDLSNLTSDNKCQCTNIGKPDETKTIDPIKSVYYK